jgi:hypothetical protein
MRKNTKRVARQLRRIATARKAVVRAKAKVRREENWVQYLVKGLIAARKADKAEALAKKKALLAQKAALKKAMKNGLYVAARASDPLPPRGVAIRAYKGVYIERKDGSGQAGAAILELVVPKHAHRIRGRDRGCKNRASEVRVVKIHKANFKFDPKIHDLVSGHNRSFVYKIGRKAIPDNFDHSRATCSNGIHFFLSPRAAGGWVNI